MMKMAEHKVRRGLYKGERGNIFLFVLVGITMFATLSFVVSRGFRSNGTSSLNKRQLELALTDIIDYGLSIEHAVNRLRRKGVSESDISFHDGEWGHTDYQHAAPQPDANKIFSGSGGRVGYRVPDGLPSIAFRDDFMVKGLGSDTNAELAIISSGISKGLCSKLNSKMGVASIPSIVALSASVGAAKGNFTPRAVKNVLGSTSALLEEQPIGCWEDGIGSGTYVYYQVLLVR